MDKVHYTIRPPEGLRDIKDLEMGVLGGAPCRDRNYPVIKLDRGGERPMRLSLRKQRTNVYAREPDVSKLTCHIHYPIKQIQYAWIRWIKIKSDEITYHRPVPVQRSRTRFCLPGS